MKTGHTLFVGKWDCVVTDCKFSEDENIAISNGHWGSKLEAAEFYLKRPFDDDFEDDTNYVVMAVREHQATGHRPRLTVNRVGVVR